MSKRGGAMRSQLFALKMKLARLEANFTQAELAGAVGKPSTWVVDVERGRTIPRDVDDCRKLAEALGLVPERVMERAIEASSQRLINSMRRAGYEIDIEASKGNSILANEERLTYGDLSPAHLADER